MASVRRSGMVYPGNRGLVNVLNMGEDRCVKDFEIF